MSTLTLTMALLMGFTGSLHCAGMCGPIIWVMPFQVLSGLKKTLAISLYHFGRISMYAVLALVLHSFRNLFHPQWQQYISIALGSALLAIGLLSFLPNSSVRVRLPWTEQVKMQLGRFISKPGIPALFIAGMLNGLLPCGLVYMALSASLVSTTSLQVAGLMYAFGIGTVSMLVALTVLKNKAGIIRITHFRKFVPVVMFVFGSLFVLRGMNLGIPYLSPKVEVTQHGIRSCCQNHHHVAHQ